MTRRASALQTSWLDATGRPAVPPAPTSGVRPRPFVVRLRSLAVPDAPGLGMWPEGEPALVEADAEEAIARAKGFGGKPRALKKSGPPRDEVEVTRRFVCARGCGAKVSGGGGMVCGERCRRRG